MVFILGKAMHMVVLELSEYYGKEPKEIDADIIVPYLLFMIITGVAEVNAQELQRTNTSAAEVGGQNLYSNDHLLNTAFKSRLLMIEFFGV